MVHLTLHNYNASLLGLNYLKSILTTYFQMALSIDLLVPNLSIEYS
jgi:hypothetical protein